MGMEESSYDVYHYECMFCGKITESSSHTLDKETLFEMGSSSCPTICDNCKGPSKRPPKILNRIVDKVQRIYNFMRF